MINDFISRSALIEVLRQQEKTSEFFDDGLSAGLARAIVEVYNAKIVDAEPVRHGEWSDYRINGYDGLHPVYETQCSLCSGYAKFTYRYCPHCGARMGGETNGDNKQ